MFEVESKYRVDSFDKLESDFEFSVPVLERDVYYQHPSKDFIDTDEWLRVRKRNNDPLCQVTYKGSRQKTESGVKIRREIEFSASVEFIELLAILGFKKLIEVEKYRRTAKCATQTFGEDHIAFQITLDDVIGLGKFVEIEAITKEEIADKVAKSIDEVAAKLHLKTVEKKGYGKLMLRKLEHEKTQTQKTTEKVTGQTC